MRILSRLPQETLKVPLLIPLSNQIITKKRKNEKEVAWKRTKSVENERRKRIEIEKENEREKENEIGKRKGKESGRKQRPEKRRRKSSLTPSPLKSRNLRKSSPI